MNGLERTEKDVIPCFETDGDVWIFILPANRGIDEQCPLVK